LIPRLHLVTDDRILGRRGFLALARNAMRVAGGEAAFHLRGRGAEGRRLWEIGEPLRVEAHGAGVTFLVNDRLDLALVLEAEGAHLGERSFRTNEARKILGSAALLGRSVHDPAGARTQVASRGADEAKGGADFLFAGPVFRTASHPGREGIGTEGLRRIVTAAGGIPVLAIGGITPERVASAIGAGAHGVAVIRAVWDEERVEDAVRGFVRELEGAEEGF